MVVKGTGMNRLDGLGHAPVEGHPAGGGHLVVEGGPHQRMAEPVPRSRLEDQAGADGFLQRGEQRFLGEVTGQPDHGRVELEADG
jgi:hypothetical protein